MAINIIDWENELSCADTDEHVGIRIATLLEINGNGTYITSIPPGLSITPHYHQKGAEEYHIVSGNGVIRLLPVEKTKASQLISKQVKAKNSFVIHPNIIHQLINNGTEPLVLIFSCPFSHLKNDRFIVQDIEEKLREKIAYSN